MMTLMDGRDSLVKELRKVDSSLRCDIAGMMTRVCKIPHVYSMLPGFLPGDPGSQARVGRLRQRIEEIAAL